MRPMAFLVLAGPVGLAVGSAVGTVIGWAYCRHMEHLLERDWG